MAVAELTAEAPRSAASLNPFQVRGTALPPNVLLAAKVVTLVFLITGGWRLTDPFLPFIGFLGDLGNLFLASQVNGNLGEVANHTFDITSHVSDFGKFRGLDFQERRIRHARQSPGNLGLANAGRADHDDVLGHHIDRHIGREFLAPHTIPQGDRNGALGIPLAHDMLIQLSYDLTRCHLVKS